MSHNDDTRFSSAGLGPRVSALPFFELVRSAGDGRTYLVGGAVRDLILGRESVDLDFAIDGPLDPVLEALDGDVTRHERFETASVLTADGTRIDLTRTRRESYEYPGALPDVHPAPIEVDLERRDFTINAMAVPLDRPDEIIDPYDGRGDLDRGLLRALHPNSFSDDPTRALRAARYAARLEMSLEDETASQLSDLNLESASVERVAAEVLLNAREECEYGSLSKAIEWGVVAGFDDHPTLLADICEVLRMPSWADYMNSVDLEGARVLAGAVSLGPGRGQVVLEGARDICAFEPSTGSEAASIAADRSPEELVLARALGAEWIDSWCESLRSVELEIRGDDLIAAGVAAGPLVGVGLGAALSAKLNGGTNGRDDELEVALEACRSADPGDQRWSG